jgi:hypothetical protein
MAVISTVGEVVRLVGLTFNQSLNGAIGIVVGNTDQESTGMCRVDLQSPAAAIDAHRSGISLSPLNLIRVFRYARSGCDQIGTKGCSASLKELYCCGECQKEDWRAHKIMCKLIKQMPDKQQPFKDVSSVTYKVLNLTEEQKSKLGTKKYANLLERAATFAEYQFGQRIAGQRAYERGNGDRHNNLAVDFKISIEIYDRLSKCSLSFNSDGSNTIDCWTKVIPYYQKSLAILEPWILQISLREGERTDVLSEEMIDYLFNTMAATQYNLRMGYRILNDLDKAIHHSKQSIYYVKKIKGGEMTLKRVHHISKAQGELYCLTDRLIEAKTVTEELYN